MRPALNRLPFFALVVALLVSAPAAWPEDEPLPVARFVEPSRISSMTLSPDGTRVAGIGHGDNGAAAFVTDLERSQTKVIARRHNDGYHLYGQWPVRVTWISNDLLALDWSDRESISVDLSGKKVATLGQRFIRRMPERADAPDSVLAYRDIEDGDIDIVNARTGERVKYRIGLPGKLEHAAFDASGALRAVTMMDTAFWSEKSKVSNWYRADEQSPWQLLEEFAVTDDYWWPVRVLPEPNSLAILSRRGRDTLAVFRYDAAARRQGEMMAGHPSEDIVRVSGLDQAVFQSVLTDGIKPQISWFDGQWAGLQAAVDAALPGRINQLQGDKTGRLLVSSYGDVDPGRWFVLDTRTSKLREIGEARPGIDPARMRPMETIQYAARDGLTIPAYLTRPARPANDPAPMVVLIHGGPQVRDRWQWNEEVQLLASRGYVVFQPQFRGSTGFGRKFEEAGYRQWGRAMQDDITDGVKHLVARKIADPNRICIYGASYGGYAALWGVVSTPELYKCGISFAGVSDLAAMASHSFMDDSTKVTRQIHRARIGDPEADRAWLEEVSPLRHAAQVRVPLLIAHGEADTRVLPSQSTKMVDALRSLGKPVEWMSFPQESHGFFLARDQLNYSNAVLAFLKRHIGEGDSPAVQSPKAP
jgi:dipeptidyl aminopeptidase/acylaminoacyl peptidase